MISVSELRQLLNYDPQSGVFTWRPRGRGVWPDKIAGSVRKDNGYVNITLRGKKHFAHRLAWLYCHGWCPMYLDHVDLDRTNNSLSNLRPATVQQNAANSGSRKNNRLGVKGVRLRKGGSYEARINVNGKGSVVIGYFKTASEAHAAYLSALKSHYGEYARGK